MIGLYVCSLYFLCVCDYFEKTNECNQHNPLIPEKLTEGLGFPRLVLFSIYLNATSGAFSRSSGLFRQLRERQSLPMRQQIHQQS